MIAVFTTKFTAKISWLITNMHVSLKMTDKNFVMSFLYCFQCVCTSEIYPGVYEGILVNPLTIFKECCWNILYQHVSLYQNLCWHARSVLLLLVTKQF